jgi:hypothetical protein
MADYVMSVAFLLCLSAISLDFGRYLPLEPEGALENEVEWTEGLP